MSTVRYTADEARRRARVNKKILDATTEADIARHAAEDDSSTDHLDLMAEFRAGRLKMVRPLDVAAIRKKTHLSQEKFADAFHISLHTLRNWEQERRVPHGPAYALLVAIDRDPKAMMRLLKAA
jgi:putative transcriptional regulator